MYIPSPYRSLYYLPNLAPASLNKGYKPLHIPERLACLSFHAAPNEIASLVIETEAS